jgi:hypothetical protein
MRVSILDEGYSASGVRAQAERNVHSEASLLAVFAISTFSSLTSS